MRDLRSAVETLGGMATKRQLVRRGARDLDLTRAVRAGDVQRVRNGWYTVLDERSPAVQAVRVGGRLTGLSAIRELGGWTPDFTALHVAVPANASRLRTRRNRHRRLDMANPRGVALHWESREQGDRGTATVVALRDALLRVILDEAEDVALAVLDWAAHSGQLDEFDQDALARELPLARRSILRFVDSGCESFPESIARTRLRCAGHRVTSQVPVGQLERIDLVIDDRIGLEVDGRTFHATTFERDSAKAVSIAAAGWLPLRVSARLVIHEWDRVLSALHAMLGNSGVAPPKSDGLPRRVRQRRGRRAASPEFPKQARRGQAQRPATQGNPRAVRKA